MKQLSILLISVLLYSCSSSEGGCVTPRDVERFDRRPFRADNWPNYNRSTLVKVTRGMNGNTHLFITDAGDTVKKLYQGVRLEVGECYMLRKDI